MERSKFSLNKIDKGELDTKFFYLGIFFLASAPFIACLLFLVPLFKGLLDPKNNLLKDSFNQILILISFILLFKSILSSLTNISEIAFLESYLNWAGIANFIPLFLCYFAFKSYLDEENKRKKVAKIFIAGTIPVLITCIGQKLFNWYGPLEIFNGLIKWFQRPIDPHDAVTGLFNNQNYTSAWLTMMWPLILTLLQEKLNLKEYFKSNILIIISILNTIFIILTHSRAGLVGLIIPIIFLIRRKYLKWGILSIVSLILLIILSDLSFISSDIKEFMAFIVPGSLETRFNGIKFDLSSYPRISLWINAITFIIQKPLFGWGASSFRFLYEDTTGYEDKTTILISHSHNLFLELSVSFGLIVSCLLFFVLITILVKSFSKIFLEKKFSPVEKGWWLSGFIFFISHFYDIFIFDIRINLAFWIIFAGLRNTFGTKTNALS